MDTNSLRKQTGETSPSLETVIVTRVRDLVDGFKVRRVLPAPRRRMVGPSSFWIRWDRKF